MDRTFDLLPDAVFVVDQDRRAFSDVNRAACEGLGYTREELLQLGPNQLCPPEDIAALAGQLDDVAAEAPATAIIRTVERRKDGRTLPVEWHVSRIREAGTEHWIIVARQLAATGRERKEGTGPICAQHPPGGHQPKVGRGKLDLSPFSVDVGEDARGESYGLGLPGHDPLTGLPDRRLFERRLDRAMERASQQDNYRFAICFIDLDDFKAINDSLGHLAGDRTLCEVARRLVGCVRPGDMAARFGGDEFTVLIDDLRDAPDAAIVGQRILDRLKAPLEIDGRAVNLTASVGVATSSTPSSVADLLHRADRAMYHAKSLGGGELATFDDETPES
jgi:diguanylate cyclase (GGDEF)-like protein/PAS domain S-box-containing protein